MEDKILIVEDDRNISNILKLQLERQGYEVTCAFDGLEGIKMAKKHKPHLILLDWMLPQISGTEVCKILKKVMDAPIIFLTSKAREGDIIEGLEVGGDDYITKPFKFEIVHARIRANLRKYSGSKIGKLKFKEISIDISSNIAYYEDNPMELTKLEYLLLTLLLSNPKSILSKNRIIHELWGDFEDDHTKGNNLEVVINSLRKKLSSDKKKYIKTHRGRGYGLI
ncbi:DNA-binding response regulator [Propionigenium maris DSM 9537]|uniref:DNA-binding response regulator n=1 Tax=Propionigenium maris DSM 9537 TaxID=1123000 RepID=A0A9W6GKA2_9FUSO|nr:response regulator transcription factor [Propionigenium maris]GLI55182.1 DNA-binding response regulator [Propionigenium maris DSM 9537]